VLCSVLYPSTGSVLLRSLLSVLYTKTNRNVPSQRHQMSYM
jgi:hypothetical protein